MFNSYSCCSCINGYSPYILNGECRFCYGKKPPTSNEKFNTIINTIDNIINHTNTNIEKKTINN